MWFAIATGSLIGLVCAAVAYVLISTPKPTDLKGCVTAKLFSVRLCPKDATYVKLKDISPHAKYAVIVSEDGSFYSHKGIDWFELQESINKNWEKGEYARGGSTITQQLAKNVYLTAEKSLLRKVREAIIATQIEKLLTKDEILERYLNVVEFGPNLYGIGRASQFYFGKSAAHLTAAEGAFLAFLLPSPKRYSMSFTRKKLSPFARSQMRSIVNRMWHFKKIDELDHLSALDQIDRFFGAPASTEELQLEDVGPSQEEMPENMLDLD